MRRHAEGSPKQRNFFFYWLPETKQISNNNELFSAQAGCLGVYHCVQKLSENDELYGACWLSNLHKLISETEAKGCVRVVDGKLSDNDKHAKCLRDRRALGGVMDFQSKSTKDVKMVFPRYDQKISQKQLTNNAKVQYLVVCTVRKAASRRALPSTQRSSVVRIGSASKRALP